MILATTLTFTGSSDDAEKAIARLERKYQDLENKIKNTSRSAKSGGSDFVGDFAKWGQSITGIGSAFDLATKAIGLFKAEYDDLLSRQNKSKDANVDFGRKAAEMAMNLGAGADPNAAIEALKQLSKRSQIPISDLTTIMDTAQAARGPLSDQRVTETIEDIAKVGNLSPEAMQPIVGASLDLQRHVPGTTSKQAAGFVMNAGAESHVQEASKFAKNLMPGITAIAGEDSGDEAFIAGTAAALTKVTDDSEGRTSRTALLQLHYQLKRALPKMKSFKERLTFAQENPDFAKAFMEGGQFRGEALPSQDMEVTGPGGENFNFKGHAASFETKAKPAILQLLGKESVGYKDQQDLITKIPELGVSDKSFDDRAKGVQENPNLSIARQANQFKVEAQIDRLNDTAGAKASTRREGVQDLLEAKGFGAFERQMMGFNSFLQFGKTREEADRTTLSEERDHYRHMAEVARPETRAGYSEKADKLDEILQILGGANANGGAEPNAGMQKAMEENNRLLEENNRLLGDAGNGGADRPRPGRRVDRNGNKE